MPARLGPTRLVLVSGRAQPVRSAVLKERSWLKQRTRRIKNNSCVVESDEARDELGQVKEELGWGSLKKEVGRASLERKKIVSGGAGDRVADGANDYHKPKESSRVGREGRRGGRHFPKLGTCPAG